MATGRMNRQKRLVFIGNYGNRNIGDDAILHILSARYLQAYPAYQQHVFVRHYAEDVARISSARPLPISLRSLLWTLLRANLIVVGGGGLFGAKMGPAARFIPLFALLCWLLGKTIVYESVGVYSNTPRLQKVLLFLSMLTAKQVSVRDATSWAVTRPLRRFKPIRRVDDPGFSITPVDTATALDLLRQEGIQLPEDRSKIIGISIKRIIQDRAETQRLMQAVIESLQWLIDQGYVLLFLPFCHDPDKWSEQDVAFAHEIMAQLKYTDGVYCVQGYYTPREVAGMMGLTRLFIGMRYHAQVFAHALHLPLLPIAYEEKRTDFIQQYGYPVIPIAGLSGRTLISHLAAMLAEPPTRGAGRSGQAVGARNLVEIAG